MMGVGLDLRGPILMMLDYSPSTPRYVFAPYFTLLDALGTMHRYLVRVEVYGIAVAGYFYRVSFLVNCGLNAESAYLFKIYVLF